MYVGLKWCLVLECVGDSGFDCFFYDSWQCFVIKIFDFVLEVVIDCFVFGFGDMNCQFEFEMCEDMCDDVGWFLVGGEGGGGQIG